MVLTEEAPVVWQVISGRHRPVEARYEVAADSTVSFALGKYDKQVPLIIDPTISYSTYWGGTDSTGGLEWGEDIAVDGDGNAYTTGMTTSVDFPTQSPFQPASRGAIDAFVTKFSSSGTVVYSTYLGGSSWDWGHGIAVDPSGSAYVTGRTFSSNYPVIGAFQPGKSGTIWEGDAFVTKLTPSGSALVYSTYLGGSGEDIGESVTTDVSGNAYLTGFTSSLDFPTVNASQPVSRLGDIFAAKLNHIGSALVYSTYMGGSGLDHGKDIVVDRGGSAYLTGSTTSYDFPVSAPPGLVPFQPTPGGDPQQIGVAQGGGYGPAEDGYGHDAVVVKLGVTGSLVYSTYLGGSGGLLGGGRVGGSGHGDEGRGIAVDESGNAYVTGITGSRDFPVVNAVQPVYGGSWPSDAFLTKLNATGSALVYSTFIGGSGGDAGNSIAVDGVGNAYISGMTGSKNFPIVRAVQANSGGSYDAFVTKVSATGSPMDYSTYVGGSGTDGSMGIAIDSFGAAYVAGRTSSTNFPSKNAIQSSNRGTPYDAFVTKIDSSDIPVIPKVSINDAAPVAEGSPAAGPYHAPGSARFTVSLSTPVSTAVTVKYKTVDGTAKATATPTGASDYMNTFGTLNFAAGELSQVVTVPVSMDNSVEDDENFFLQLSEPSLEVGLGDPEGEATIVSDDPNTSTLSIGNVEVIEGFADTTTQAVFTLSLSRPAAGLVTARVSTVGGTAHSTNNDFVAVTQDVTFARDEMTKQVAVTVKGDDIAEPNEYFFLQLESSFGAYPANRRGTATIRSDDDDTVVSVSDASVLEGASGTTTQMAFTVSLSEPSHRTVTLGYATSNVTARTTDNAAMGAADYTPVSGTLVFAPGESSKTVVVNVIGDNVREPDEQLLLTLTSTANSISAKRAGVGTIRNDD